MVAGPTAQAADTTLTLACQGTTSDRIDTMKDAKPAKPEKYPISLGIIVNFTNRTVQGLLIPPSEEVKINDITDLVIAFDSSPNQGSIRGTIDRVTGALEATVYWNGSPSTDYSLKCRPTQRMF